MQITEALKNSIRLINAATPLASTPKDRALLMETQKTLLNYLSFLNRENEIHSKPVHKEMELFNFSKEDLLQMHAYYNKTTGNEQDE